MIRIYRATISLEARFEKKIAARAWAKRLARSIEAPKPWAVVNATCVSRVVKEAKPPRPSDERDALLARFRSVLEEIRAASGPRTPAAHIRWVDRGGCGRPHGHGGHCHKGRWFVRRAGGERVRLPWNLICLNPRRWIAKLDGVGNESWRDAALAKFVAHELAHFVTTKRHGSVAFEGAEDRLFANWEAYSVRRSLGLPGRSGPAFSEGSDSTI